MKIEVNKHKDVVCQAGNVYEHSKRVGIYFCYISRDEGKQNLLFVNLVDGLSYYFSYAEMQLLTCKGKILNIEV